MKTKYLAAIAAALSTVVMIPAQSVAGNAEGNGGTSVVCRNSAGKITFASLLDLYEGRKLPTEVPKLNITETADLFNDQLERATHRISEVFDALSSQTFITRLQNELTYVQDNIRPVDSDVELIPTTDVFPVIRERGCRIEQVANFRPNGIVLIDPLIYGAMSATSQAALHVHEAIYKILRKDLGATDSQSTRRIVALLFADSIDKDWLKKSDLGKLVGRDCSVQISASGPLAWVSFGTDRNYNNMIDAEEISQVDLGGKRAFSKDFVAGNRYFFVAFSGDSKTLVDTSIQCGGKTVVSRKSDPASVPNAGRAGLPTGYQLITGVFSE